MNTKAKLLSLCLAAVLLCGCIVGFLVTGASAAATTWTVDGTGGTDTTFKTIQEAMERAATTEWAADSSLVIKYSKARSKGNTGGAAANAWYVDTNGVLFGVETIWRADDTKLPITISGYANASTQRVNVAISTNSAADLKKVDTTGTHTVGEETITIAANADVGKRVVCTNDYNFTYVEFLSNYGTIYAGCGNVTYTSCRQTTKHTVINADNFTEVVFRGWTPARVAKYQEDGLFRTSMTLGGGSTTTYYSGKNGAGTVNVVAYSPEEEVTAENKDTITYEADETARAALGEAMPKPSTAMCEFTFGNTSDSVYLNSTLFVRAGSSPVHTVKVNMVRGKAYKDSVDKGQNGGVRILPTTAAVRYGEYTEINYGNFDLTGIYSKRNSGTTYARELYFAYNADLVGDLVINATNYTETIDTPLFFDVGASIDGTITINSTTKNYGMHLISGTAPKVYGSGFTFTSSGGTVTNFYVRNCDVTNSGATITNFYGENCTVTLTSGKAVNFAGKDCTTTVKGVHTTINEETQESKQNKGIAITSLRPVGGTFNVEIGDLSVTDYYLDSTAQITAAEGASWAYTNLYATASPVIGSVTNEFVAGTGTHTSEEGEFGGVVNTIYVGSVPGSIYGTGDTVDGDVVNNLEGITLTGGFFGTGAAITGSVENNLTDVEFATSGKFFRGSVGTVEGNVTNNLTNVTGITRFWGATNSVEGTIYNEIKNVVQSDEAWFYAACYNGTVVDVETNVYGHTAKCFMAGGGLDDSVKCVVTGGVTTNIYDATYTTRLSAGNKSGSFAEGASSVVNIYKAEIKQLQNNDWTSDIDIPVVSEINIYLNNDASGDVIVSSHSRYEDSVLNIYGGENGKLIFNSADTQLTVAAIDGVVNVEHNVGWGANYAAITYTGEDNLADLVNATTAEGAYGAPVFNGNVLMGAAVDVSGNLVLSDRINVRFYFNKEAVDALGKDKFTLAVTLGGVALTGSDLMEDEKGYYIEVAGISPKDLTTEIAYSGNFVTAATIDLKTILEKTKVGASAELVALCDAIAALAGDTAGKVAAVDMTGAYAETSEVITGFGIVMNDAVGYTLYAADAATAAATTYTVKVNGVVVEGVAFNEEGLMDIFVKVAKADDMMKIEVLDGETSVFTMEASVAQVAATYVDNVDATNILAYIQAANAYKAYKASL